MPEILGLYYLVSYGYPVCAIVVWENELRIERNTPTGMSKTILNASDIHQINIGGRKDIYDPDNAVSMAYTVVQIAHRTGVEEVFIPEDETTEFQNLIRSNMSVKMTIVQIQGGTAVQFAPPRSCVACNGTGKLEKPCPTCNGTGAIYGYGPDGRVGGATCYPCNGTGKHMETCAICHGTGRQS